MFLYILLKPIQGLFVFSIHGKGFRIFKLSLRMNAWFIDDFCKPGFRRHRIVQPKVTLRQLVNDIDIFRITIVGVQIQIQGIAVSVMIEIRIRLLQITMKGR